MKSILSALALAAAIASYGASASAAVIDYTAVVDLDPSMFDISGNLIVPLPGGPIAIAVGDTLEGTITFANNGRITVFDGAQFPGSEWITGSFLPDLGTTAFSTGSFQLLGVEGDYLAPTTIQSSPASGALVFSKVTNYTDTSFSFTGVTFSLTYVDNHTPDDFPLTSHVTPSRLAIALTPAAISEGPAGVPEPATWALATLGFASIGSALRRRRAQGLASA